jgi:pimeloyl-ACP methyl ester carboxylesterase
MGAVGGHGRLGVVFVHGFNSSASMWEPFTSLIDQDEGLERVTSLPFSYDTRLWQRRLLRQIPTLDTVADSMKEFLDTDTEDFDRLVLVCHSQGGLVAQRCLVRMLAEGRGTDLARIRRVVLLACPNNGSQLALSLRRIALGCNPQEHQLRPLVEQITATQRSVLRDIVNTREVTARTCPIPFSVYAGETDNIVTPASAQGAFPDAAALPGDHSSIVRPTSHRHRSYTTVKRLLLTAFGTEPPPTGRTALTGPVPAALEAGSATTPGAPAQPEPTEVAPASPVPGGSALAGFPLPETFTVVLVAERVTDMDDPDFRRRVISLMRQSLAPEAGFSPAFRAHPRDHVLEIVERCQSHRLPDAALAAFRDAVTFLRPDDSATAELRALIRDPE